MPVFDEFDDPTVEDDERSAVIRRLDNLMADPVRQDFNDPDVVAYTDRQRDRLHRAADKKDALAAQVLMRWHRDQGELSEGYFWELVVGGIFGERGPRTLPPISKRLSKRKRAEIERRAAAWLTARGIKPMHTLEK